MSLFHKKHHHHHHHRRKAPPRAPWLYGVTFNHGVPMSTITLAFNLPTARTDGSALALTDIASYTVTPAATGGTVSPPTTVPVPAAGWGQVAQTFTDNAPDFGQTESYSVVATDVEGNVSAAATGSVVVPPTQLAPPNAPDSLVVTFNP